MANIICRKWYASFHIVYIIHRIWAISYDTVRVKEVKRFKRDDSRCAHACNSFQFHMENLHVWYECLMICWLTYVWKWILFSVLERKHKLSASTSKTTPAEWWHSNAFSCYTPVRKCKYDFGRKLNLPKQFIFIRYWRSTRWNDFNGSKF